MDKHAVEARTPDALTPVGSGRGIIRELGGRGGWRLWWPVALWMLIAASISTVWPQGYTAAPIPLLLGGPAAVILIWVMGARRAIQRGHDMNLVRMAAAAASVLVSAGSIVVGAVARIIEAAVRGNDNARIFITTFGKDTDHMQFVGVNETLYVDFALPLTAVVVLVCWFLVGRVHTEA